MSLEFEYLHQKCQCKMLIGRDDISKDVITHGACFHVLFNVCLHSCWFPLCADWWKSDSSVDVEPLGNWRQNSNFRDIHVVVSSPSFFLPWCQRPPSACSQATSVTSRQSTVSSLFESRLLYLTHVFYFLKALVNEMGTLQDMDISPPENDEAGDDFLFPDDLEDLDSDMENNLLEDSISIVSTPKPSLRY